MIKPNVHILLFSIALAGFVLVGLPASSQALTTQQANDICSLKINEQNCRDDVNTCQATDQDCLRSAVRKGAAVIGACQDSQDPQKCHNTCKGKTGSELANCVQQVSGDNSSNNVGDNGSLSSAYLEKKNYCGKVDKIYTQFDLGCKGAKGPDSGILDLAFSIVRFLTIGVGIALTMSIIYAGIQYSTSGGNPEQTSKAKQRILNAMIGLLFFLMISALAQFLIPGGLF